MPKKALSGCKLAPERILEIWKAHESYCKGNSWKCVLYILLNIRHTVFKWGDLFQSWIFDKDIQYSEKHLHKRLGWMDLMAIVCNETAKNVFPLPLMKLYSRKSLLQFWEAWRGNKFEKKSIIYILDEFGPTVSKKMQILSHSNFGLRFTISKMSCCLNDVLNTR